MPEFGMREARKTLSRLIERAQYGEDVVITQDGVPVAQIVPIRKGVREAEAPGEPEAETLGEPDALAPDEPDAETQQ